MIKYSVKKYIVTTVFAASLIFTPILGSSVFAYGGPEAGTSEETAQQAQSNIPADSGLISEGDRGAAVEGLQNLLSEKGYATAADGIFGANTGQQLRAFQGDNGLAVDGIAGPATIDALNGTSDSNNAGEIEVTEVVNESNQDEVQTATPQNPSVQSVSVDAEAEAQVPANSGVVAVAESLLGSPYVSGGTTPAGFDSSGFINYAFAQVGVSLDRTHAGMWANNGVHVDHPEVGDVVFFANTYKSGVSHSGIYIGNNQMIHAGTEETGVEVENMGWDYWSSRYIGAKRFN